jgi:hypothetical protein
MICERVIALCTILARAFALSLKRQKSVENDGTGERIQSKPSHLLPQVTMVCNPTQHLMRLGIASIQFPFIAN